MKGWSSLTAYDVIVLALAGITLILAIVSTRKLRNKHKSAFKADTVTMSAWNAAQSQQKKEQFDEKIETLIANHHEEAINEAKTQFWFSLIFACIGFIFIATTFVFSKDTEWYNKLVMTIPGAIIEAVSALFFSQSKETRERSSDFLNRLREDRKFEKGLEIANTVEDKKLKAKMLASIALNLCGIGDAVLHDADAGKEEKPSAPKE